MTEETKKFLIRYAEAFYMMNKGYYEKYYKQNQEYYKKCGYSNVKERNQLSRERAKTKAKILTIARAEDFAWEATGEAKFNHEEVWEVLTKKYPEMV